VKLDLEYSIKEFVLSNDENFVITYSGYGSQKQTESKAEAGKEQQKPVTIYTKLIIRMCLYGI
jgi:hypothetical protein